MCNLNVPSIRWSNFLLISDCWTLPLSILKLFKPPLFLSWESCSCLLFWVFALMPQIKGVSFQTPPCTPAPAILSRPPAVPCQDLLWLAGGGRGWRPFCRLLRCWGWAHPFHHREHLAASHHPNPAGCAQYWEKTVRECICEDTTARGFFFSD